LQNCLPVVPKSRSQSHSLQDSCWIGLILAPGLTDSGLQFTGQSGGGTRDRDRTASRIGPSPAVSQERYVRYVGCLCHATQYSRCRCVRNASIVRERRVIAAVRANLRLLTEKRKGRDMFDDECSHERWISRYMLCMCSIGRVLAALKHGPVSPKADWSVYSTRPLKFSIKRLQGGHKEMILKPTILAKINLHHMRVAKLFSNNITHYTVRSNHGRIRYRSIMFVYTSSILAPSLFTYPSSKPQAHICPHPSACQSPSCCPPSSPRGSSPCAPR
jgi:hypothetical protein